MPTQKQVKLLLADLMADYGKDNGIKFINEIPQEWIDNEQEYSEGEEDAEPRTKREPKVKDPKTKEVKVKVPKEPKLPKEPKEKPPRAPGPKKEKPVAIEGSAPAPAPKGKRALTDEQKAPYERGQAKREDKKMCYN